MSEYFFRRYCNGTRMAEGVQITKAVTLEDACIAASRIAAQYKDGTTLVYVPTDVLWAHKQLAQDRALIDALRAELAAERERQNNLAEWSVLLCDELEAVLGGEYADQHGPLFEIVQSVRARAVLKGDDSE